jgi:hypothetical protein
MEKVSSLIIADIINHRREMSRIQPPGAFEPTPSGCFN